VSGESAEGGGEAGGGEGAFGFLFWGVGGGDVGGEDWGGGERGQVGISRWKVGLTRGLGTAEYGARPIRHPR